MFNRLLAVKLLTLAIVTWPVFTSPLQADVIIDIQDQTVVAGTIDSLNIVIRSTGNDPLGLYSYYLRITPIAESGGTLQFAPTASQIANEKNDINYVFGTDSQLFSATRQDPNVFEVVGSDFATNNVIIGATNRLLAKVELQHLTPTPLTATGSYRVSLVQNVNFTFFQNLNGNNIPIDASSFALAGQGIVTVVAAPEPTSLAWLGLGALALARRRFRKAKNAPKLDQ